MSDMDEENGVDLREQVTYAIDAWLNEPDGGETHEALVQQGTDAVMAVFERVQGVYETDVMRVLAAKNEGLAAKDTEIARLHGDVGRAKDALGIVRAKVPQVSQHRIRARLLEAEAERDRLRARLTGVAIHAHRLANRIQPGTPAWAALADLRAALAQPSPHDALVNDLEAATARHANDHIAALDQHGDQEGTGT